MTSPITSLRMRIIARGASATIAEHVAYVPARILYPALGCPEVACPTSTSRPSDPCIHLLILAASPSLTAEDIARHLRYVPWAKRHTHHLDPSPGQCSFSEYERPPSPGDPDGQRSIFVKHIKPCFADKNIVQVDLGSIRLNLAEFVLDFYGDKKRFGDQPLSCLYDVTLTQAAAASLDPGQSPYHLFWNNPPDCRADDTPSAEMMALLDGFTEAARLSGHCEPDWLADVVLARPAYEFEYDRQVGVSKERTEVLHPLFVIPEPKKQLTLAHLADPHLSLTMDALLSCAQKGGEAAHQWMLNPNDEFSELYKKAQESADLIVLTGDIIDYGRGYVADGPLGRNESYKLDANWFLFYSLLVSGPGGYSKPCFTVLGNHDWRLNPYPPMGKFYNLAGDIQLRPEELVKIHGPGVENWAAFHPPSERVEWLVDVDRWANHTDLESVKWYLLLINPFLDYVMRFPSSYALMGLDWCKNEDVIGVSLPVANDSLSPGQQKLASWFFLLKCEAKIVGLHAGLVSPYGSWDDDELATGVLEPCRLCQGTGVRFNARATEASGQWEPLGIPCECVGLLPSNARPFKHPIIPIGYPERPQTPRQYPVLPVHGTIGRNRWRFLVDLCRNRASLVLSGHAHRNSAFVIRRKPGSPPLETPPGTAVLVGGTAADSAMDIALEAVANPPVFLNTSSAGMKASRLVGGRKLDLEPCYAEVVVSSDGVVHRIKFKKTRWPLRPRRRDGGYSLVPPSPALRP